ncbi:MAG: T9SS type A sorting domain-containing protein [Bacteroidetes bacterium]|nr:T9SS type A sorting domain-containing protein [Bacteroidota bacterium]
MKKIITISFLLISKIFFSQINFIERTGIPDSINFSLNVKNTGEIFVGRNYGKILFSEDNGLTWEYRYLPDTVGAITALASTPDGSIYAGTFYDGVFKSNNNGLTWIQTTLPATKRIIDIKTDSIGRIYVLKFENISSDYDKVLYTSVDSGYTWNMMTIPLQGPYQSLSVSADGVLLLSDNSINYQYSLDNGITWQSKSDQVKKMIKYGVNGKYYLLTSNSIISKTNLSDITSTTETTCNLCLNITTHNDAIVVTDGGTLEQIKYYKNGIWQSISYTRSSNFASIDPNSGQVIFSCNDDDKIYKLDCSPNCEVYQLTTNPDWASNYVYAAPNSNLIYTNNPSSTSGATGQHLLYESDDKGISWHTFKRSYYISPQGVPAYSTDKVKFNPYNGDTYVLSAGQYLGDYYSSYVYRKRFNTLSFDTIAIAIDSLINNITFGEANTIFATSNQTKKIYKSTDNGITWNNLSFPISMTNIASEYTDLYANNNVLLVIADATIGTVLLKSYDSGTTWSSPLSTNFTYFFENNFNNDIYVKTNWGDVYKSTDNGLTFNQFINVSNYDVKDILINSCGTIYIASPSGIHSSIDNGITWITENSTSTSSLATNDEGDLFAIQYQGTLHKVKVSTAPLSYVQNCMLVWPGDADNNQIVDNTDMLQIGLYYNNTGSPRTTSSNDWLGYPASDWGVLQYNNYDIKSVDCNGDGIINMLDTIAINENYSFVHPRQEASITTTNYDLFLKSNSSSYTAGNFIEIELWTGDSTNLVPNLYGLSFNIITDKSLLVDSLSFISYNNSWIKNTNNYVSLFKNTNTAYEGTVCRTDHNDTTGYGKIGSLIIKTNSNISQLEELNILFNSIKAINKNGEEIFFNSANKTIYINPTVTNINNNPNKWNSNIYPNPANNYINLTYDIAKETDVNIELYNYTGEKICDLKKYYKKKIGSHTENISLEEFNLANGVYFIKTIFEDQYITHKIIKQ